MLVAIGSGVTGLYLGFMRLTSLTRFYCAKNFVAGTRYAGIHVQNTSSAVYKNS